MPVKNQFSRKPGIELAPEQSEIKTDGLPYLPVEANRPPAAPLSALAGPVGLGAELSKLRTVNEGIPAGLKSGSASFLKGLLEGIPLAGRAAGLGPAQIGAQEYLPAPPKFDPLEDFKSFLSDVENSNNYTGKYYEKENLPSLFKKFTETQTPEDFERFIDYTVNRTAQQLPLQAVLWGSAAVGVPAPVALSLMGVSAAGNQYSEDQDEAGRLSEKDRVNRSLISGAAEAGTEGLSYGMKAAAVAGKSALEAIPGIKPLMARAIAKGSNNLFTKAVKAMGASPARRILSQTLLNMLGEGSEEVVNEAISIMSDEHYKVRSYTSQQKLDMMIESFGIGAISAGVVGSPMIAAQELHARRETGNPPSPEELFTVSHIIKVFKNGLPGSVNPENQIHIANGDVILLETLVDDMIQNQEWNDAEGAGGIEAIGHSIKEAVETAKLREPSEQFDLFAAATQGKLKNESEVAYGSKEIEKDSLEKIISEIQGKFSSQNVRRAGVVRELRQRKFVSFKGRKITGPDDIAQLHQVFRSPTSETFVYYIVRPNGKIFTNKAVSSGQVDQVVIDDDIFESIYADLLASGKGSKLYLAHNHPSGRTQASSEDVLITRKIAEKFPTAYDGHVIIDHGEYLLIDRDFGQAVREYKLENLEHSWVKDAGQVMRDPEALAIFFDDVLRGPRHLHVPFLNKANAVIAYEIFNPVALGSGLFKAILDAKARYAATAYIAMGDSQTASAFSKDTQPDGLLDVITVDLGGKYMSLVERRGSVKTVKNTSAIFEPSDGYGQKSLKDQPEEVKRHYNRGELHLAISEVTLEMAKLVDQEAIALEDLGSSIKGGQVFSYEKENEEAGYARTSLPSFLKHPKSGNKPTNKKQWRELAVSNLDRGTSATSAAEEYRALLQQKQTFIEKLVDIEMEAASMITAQFEESVPKVDKFANKIVQALDEKTGGKVPAFKKWAGLAKQEQEWFELATKQMEIFDEVPPSDYDGMKTILDGIDPSDLKDINGVEMHFKDFYRNFETVFGSRLPQIEKSILRPLDEAVNEYVEFQKRMTQGLKTEIIDKLGIKKKSDLSAAIQLYGEGQMPESDLVKMFGSPKAERIKQAERWFRKQYDELLEKVNSVRARIYPNNPAKLIPRRANYFRHFFEMTEWSGLKNLFDTPANIPSELAGTSIHTRPKSKFLPWAQQRKTLRTEIDAVGGFLNYIPSAAHAIYVDPLIPKLRALEKHLRVLSKETKNINGFIEFLMLFTNDIAGKTNVLDRFPTQIFGRKLIRLINMLNNRAKKNLVLYNISSTVSQLFNLPQAIARTKIHFAVGSADYMKSIFVKGGAHERSLFLNTRYGSDVYDAFEVGVMSKPRMLSKWMLQAFDEVATKMTWYSFYDQALANKIQDPVRYADVNTRKMVAGRALHEVPIGQKARSFQVLSPFMLEATNLWWILAEDISKKEFVGLILYACAAWLMNSGAEIIRGYRVVFDPIDMLVDALSGDKTIPQRVGRVLGEITASVPFGKNVQEWYPEYGGPVPGMKYLGGNYRMPTRQQFFGDNDRTRFGSPILAVSFLRDPLFSAILPAGGQQLKKTLSGAEALRDGYVDAGSKKIKIIDSPMTAVKALAFGKSSIPEVREHYKTQAEKRANPSGEKKKTVEGYGEYGGKKYGSYGGRYGKYNS